MPGLPCLQWLAFPHTTTQKKKRRKEEEKERTGKKEEEGRKDKEGGGKEEAGWEVGKLLTPTRLPSHPHLPSPPFLPHPLPHLLSGGDGGGWVVVGWCLSDPLHTHTPPVFALSDDSPPATPPHTCTLPHTHTHHLLPTTTFSNEE